MDGRIKSGYLLIEGGIVTYEFLEYGKTGYL